MAAIEPLDFDTLTRQDSQNATQANQTASMGKMIYSVVGWCLFDSVYPTASLLDILLHQFQNLQTESSPKLVRDSPARIREPLDGVRQE